MELLAALEQTPPSIFVRESLWAFPLMLIIHALGMAFLVGPALALDLRLLGVARGAPLALFARFFPAMQAGFVASLVSGLALLLAYPAKALTNPVFYLKFAFLIAAGVLTWVFAKRVLAAAAPDGASPAWARGAAVLSIVFWAGAIAAGRLLAYTHTVLFAH